MPTPQYVIVTERWTQTEGWRKIGDGDWQPIDLTVFGGRVPFITLDVMPEFWMREYLQPIENK